MKNHYSFIYSILVASTIFVALNVSTSSAEAPASIRLSDALHRLANFKQEVAEMTAVVQRPLVFNDPNCLACLRSVFLGIPMLLKRLTVSRLTILQCRNGLILYLHLVLVSPTT